MEKTTIAWIVAIALIAIFSGSMLMSTLSTEDPHKQGVYTISSNDEIEKDTITIPACAEVRSFAYTTLTSGTNSKNDFNACVNGRAYTIVNGLSMGSFSCNKVTSHNHETTNVLVTNKVLTSAYTLNIEAFACERCVGDGAFSYYDSVRASVTVAYDYILDSDCDGVTDDIDECLGQVGTLEYKGCAGIIDTQADVAVPASTVQVIQPAITSLDSNFEILSVSFDTAYEGQTNYVDIVIENSGERDEEIEVSLICNEVVQYYNLIEMDSGEVRAISANMFIESSDYVCIVLVNHGDNEVVQTKDFVYVVQEAQYTEQVIETTELSTASDTISIVDGRIQHKLSDYTGWLVGILILILIVTYYMIRKKRG